MNSHEKLFARKSVPERSARIFESILGCKWSLTIYKLLAHNINRPGEMVRTVEGLSTKVLNECLRRNVEHGILAKTVYPEVPPRVEYHITATGKKFVGILEALEELQDEIVDNR